jgi:transposase-like protein
VLGLRIGATENSSCTELLVDLRERGVRMDTTKLFVLDGAKALRKAVLDVFCKKAIVQRCQLHKTRNVTEQLPANLRESIAAAMRQAYTSSDPKRARTLLLNLARRLRDDHPDAAASLEEGLDETLTILRFGLSERLARALSNTNMIENLIRPLPRYDASREALAQWHDDRAMARRIRHRCCEAIPPRVELPRHQEARADTSRKR